MSVSIKAPDENPSNIESILSDTIGLPGYTINPPGSRIEELLIELNELIKSGGDSDAYATDLSLTIDSSTYIITAVLKNKDGESIGTPQTIDLPMESVVVSGSYNSQTKKVVLTLQNGSTIEFSVADLINGLQAEITSNNKLNADLVDDTTSTNKFVTSADKSAWNSKQNALVVGTNLDDVPTEDSTNPITSGGVFDTVGNIDAALDSLIMSLEPKTITENGTYDPTDDGVDGYSEVTVNVPSSGGSSGTDVIFYDYDGSVVASYLAADFANLSAMPANPTHTGLTAQGWNWSLADAKAYVASDGKLNIGQMYITSDGKTKLYFTVAKNQLSVELYLNLESDTELDVDWGDGSTHTTWASTDGDSSKSHEYASAGRYVIAITVVTGEYSLSTAVSNTYKVEIGNSVVGISEEAFSYCYSLSSITIPNSVTSIGSNAFNSCYPLSSITIPNSVTSIDNNAFNSCSALSSITIPNSVTSIGYYAFESCLALPSITFESSTPPQLSGTFEIPYACIIRVPQGSLSAYTSASNYPDPSEYIYEEY